MPQGPGTYGKTKGRPPKKGKNKKMAKKLARWLLKDLELDFELILDPPTEDDICRNLEEHQEKI